MGQILGRISVVTTIPPSLVTELRRNPLIDYVVPVGRVEFDGPVASPAPPAFSQQDTTWNIERVSAPEAWSSSTGSGAKVLVIDTGTRNDHPDLGPSVVQACDSSNGLDTDGHGSHVGGIVSASDDNDNIVGTAPGVTYWSSRIDFGPSDVWCAIEFARVNDVSVINMSFTTTETQALTDMIKGAYADGIFLAKSAGNTYGGSVTYPATLWETVAVTAVDINDNVASFAPDDWRVDLAAPGVNILSTSYPSGSSCTQGTYTGYCSGTSMAAPHVAGAAAILKAYNPSWSNGDIRKRLEETAIGLGPSNLYGHGLIDIRAALDWVPPPPDPLEVTIDGPNWVPEHAWEACSWHAQTTGGSGTKTYEWVWDGQVTPPPAPGPDWWGDTGWEGYKWIEVTVTDDTGSAYDSMQVYVDSETEWGNCL